MGYFPRSIRRRQHRQRMRLIAMAALGGAVFVQLRGVRGSPWYVRFPDGKESHTWASKSIGAMIYMQWLRSGGIRWITR